MPVAGPQVLSLAAGLFVINTASGFYQTASHPSLSQSCARAALALLMALPLTYVIFSFLPEGVGNRGAITLAAMFGVAAVTLRRVYVTHTATGKRARSRVLVYGAGDAARLVGATLRQADPHVEIVGFYPGANETELVVPEAERLPTNRSLKLTAERLRVDEIVVALSERRGGSMPLRELLDCKIFGIRVHDIATHFEKTLGQIRIGYVNAGWLIFGDGFNQGLVRTAVKRVFDIVCLLSAAAGAGRAADAARRDRHQARQPRPGALPPGPGGSTACPSACQVPQHARRCRAGRQPRWATAEDDRVTRVGRLIRLLRIDELPQLFNVLRGDMSLVGPRPERPFFVEQLTQQVPYFAVRHSVKPGVTGWAQVRYQYGSTVEDAVEKLQYDLYYVKNHSPLPRHRHPVRDGGRGADGQGRTLTPAGLRCRHRSRLRRSASRPMPDFAVDPSLAGFAVAAALYCGARGSSAGVRPLPGSPPGLGAAGLPRGGRLQRRLGRGGVGGEHRRPRRPAPGRGIARRAALRLVVRVPAAAGGAGPTRRAALGVAFPAAGGRRPGGVQRHHAAAGRGGPGWRPRDTVVAVRCAGAAAAGPDAHRAVVPQPARRLALECQAAVPGSGRDVRVRPLHLFRGRALRQLRPRCREHPRRHARAGGTAAVRRLGPRIGTGSASCRCRARQRSTRPRCCWPGCTCCSSRRSATTCASSAAAGAARCRWAAGRRRGAADAAGLLGHLRAKLRVFVGKHFFSYRYDYREEWLRFTAMLSTRSSPQEMSGLIVRGLADLVESPGGSLWSQPPATRASCQGRAGTCRSGRRPGAGGFRTSALPASARAGSSTSTSTAPPRALRRTAAAWLLAGPNRPGCWCR
jgi:hypothetical protein